MYDCRFAWARYHPYRQGRLDAALNVGACLSARIVTDPVTNGRDCSAEAVMVAVIEPTNAPGHISATENISCCFGRF